MQPGGGEFAALHLLIRLVWCTEASAALPRRGSITVLSERSLGEPREAQALKVLISKVLCQQGGTKRARERAEGVE
jgi:hypothetical protein